MIHFLTANSVESWICDLLQEDFLSESDGSLVIQLASNDVKEGSLAGKKKEAVIRKAPSSKETLASLFPSSTVSNLHSSLASINAISSEGCSSSKRKFLLICETFLRMYSVIFRRLQSFVLEKQGWIKRCHQQVPFVEEEHKEFRVRVRITSSKCKVHHPSERIFTFTRCVQSSSKLICATASDSRSKSS